MPRKKQVENVVDEVVEAPVAGIAPLSTESLGRQDLNEIRDKVNEVISKVNE